ncbi:hypothetical protein AAG570_009386 [Ranatra chinensis]|uniref:Pyridoxal phosphate homeostasis protein n=1 Tax=Ranatra chinensis TaxID=642074 RepID=A0ABD0YNX4_9HEMI
MIKRTMTDVNVLKGLQNVRDRINSVCLRIGKENKPRLVAVSKTKPKEMLISAYEAGQRHFGENYIQELVEKSKNPEILEHCKDIQWHFIGHIQRNKVNKLVSVPGLFIVETVDNIKLASTLNESWGNLNKTHKLNVMVQVNTSEEKEKSGCSPKEVNELASHIFKNCKNLNLFGLMTIGQFGYDSSKGPNPDFLCLVSCRENVSKNLELNPDDLELSMGMSDDFEHAIELGSTNVRVGSSIFGFRERKPTKDSTKDLTQAMEEINVK